MVTKLERENNTIFYLHNAWANSPDGTAGFALEESEDAAYIGNCISMSSAEVLNPSSYNWIAVEFEAVEESDTAELTELGEDVPEDPEDEDDDYSYEDYMDGAVQAAADTATTAQESADIAQQKAEEATASAALAQQKAEEATASAAEAKTAADTAREKAEAATTDAATAKQKAEEATSSAALAQQKAESATAAAGTAQSAAQSATSDARAAGIAAATAQAAAEAAQGDIDDQKKYFYHDKLGAHVLDAAGGAYRTDIKSDGVQIVQTETETPIAKYGKSAIIGKNKSDNIQIKDNGFSINHDGNEMFAVKQEDEENNYINEIMEATYEASTDTYSLESSYKTYYPNKLPILYVIYRRKPDGIVSRKETIQYGDTKLPCTVSITEEGKYLVQFKKTDWDKSWRDMDPEIEMDYYAAGGGAMVTIGTRIDYGLANDGSWSLTVGSANTAGIRSIAVGENNVARDNSVAIGSMCYAKNDAIAVGSYAKATSYGSAAIGHHVSTDQMGQLVVGHYNRETTYGTMFVVGCGGDSETANAAAIMDSGDIRLKGTVYVGCDKDSTGGKSIIDLIYPVGSIYMSVNSADPGTLFGGTWERIQDKFLLASGNAYGAGTTGGSAKATLPSHTHTVGSGGYQLWGAKIGAGSTESGNKISGDAKYYAAATGGSTSNYKWLESVDSKGVSDVSQANMPPYLSVYVWKRIS